jgi:hypothetical protein
MTPVVFELAIPGFNPPQTHALDHAATGTGGADWSAFIKIVRSRGVSTVHTEWTVIKGKGHPIHANKGLEGK